MENKFYIGILMVALAGLWTQVGAESWQSNLKSGGVVQVDPQTHKPTIYYRGGSTQLWDGVHELDDGSVLIVRDGVAVPDESMLQTWQGEPPRTAMERDTLCKRLIRKACGLNGECAGARACGLARQLERMAREEARRAPYGQVPASQEECRKGLADDSLFPACARDSEMTPCKSLVRKVCGAKNQCAAADACGLAQQLQSMEREERSRVGRSGHETEIGTQCREATQNPYFAPCPAE
jgi:hypothetical protein